MNHLHWLIPERSSQNTEDLKNSNLASVRLRCVPSLAAAKKMGWQISFGEEVPDSSSLVMVGKIGAHQLESREPWWLSQIQRMKNQSRIFIDYTDHHLGFDSEMSSFYKSAISLADVCIAPSGRLASLLSQVWSGPINCIVDPVEIQIQKSKHEFKKPTTLLWFGHASNIQFLIDFLATGFVSGDKVRLIVLSNEAGLNYFTNSSIVSNAEIEINLALWSLDGMLKASKFSDICIIPSDLNNPKKMGVSSNRLLTALALGLPVAADNIESYCEFDRYYSNIRSDTFRSMLKNPTDFRKQVEDAQETILPRFSISAIEDCWRNLYQLHF